MATIIKLKRGTSTPTTGDLANGEVGIDTSAKKFYINDSGTIKEIGGSTGDATSPLAGDVRGYTGDGSTTAYTVSSGADVENVLVFVNGVYQRPTTDYTVSGTTLTFGTAPASADAITIKELVEGANIINDTGLVRSYTGDGSTTAYNVTSGKDAEEFLVFINGVYQRPTNEYTVSSGTLTFNTAPVDADVITIKELAEGTGTEILTIADDTSTTTSFNAGDTLTLSGGTGLSSTISGDVVTFAIDNTVTTNSGTQTLTNKTINSASNTITITESNISDLGSYITASSTDTLSNKTIDSASNTLTLDLGEGTLTGTTAEFNTALQDGSFATLAGTETLTNKTLDAPTFTGNATFDTNTLYVDSSNNRVGIGTTSPAYQFEIENTGANALLVLDRTDGAACFIEGQSTRSAFGSVGATPLALAYNSAAVVTIGASGAITVNPDGANPFTFPTSDGSANQVLQTDGSGNLSFATVSSASTLTIADDTSTTASIDLNSETLTVAGGTGITTAVSGNTLTITGSATQNTFSTINLNDSTNIVADSTSDTLNLDSSGLISITGDASTDTVTVSTVTSATVPFLKADGSSSDIDLQTQGSLSDVITNLYIPFTIADGSAQTSLVVGSS